MAEASSDKVYSFRSPQSFLYFLLRRPFSTSLQYESSFQVPLFANRTPACPRFLAPRAIVIADPLSRDISHTGSPSPYAFHFTLLGQPLSESHLEINALSNG